MSDKNRTIVIGVVVGLFIVANIIAGIYKWGSSGTAPHKQVAQVEETGDQQQEIKEQENEMQASKAPPAQPEEQKDSGETVGEPVVKEKDQVRSAEKKQPEADAAQTVLQQQILACKNEKSALENQINGLRGELRAKQDLAAQNQQFSEQIRECSAARELLQKEITEMQSGNSQYKELAARNEELTNEVREYANKTNNYQKEISNLQKRIDQYQKLDAENKQLRAKLVDSNRQNEALKTRLDKIREMITVE